MNRWILSIFLVFIVGWANAAEEDNTETEMPEKISLNTALVTTELKEYNPIVGQKIIINYQLAVPGYFNGATRFELPSLSKGRLAIASEFAINGNTVIDGQQYATQVWQVNLYPEQKGLLSLPALHFIVQYVDEKQNKQVVTLRSDNVAVFAYLPEALKAFNHYIVSNDVSLSEDWSAEKEQYQVGDIIQRDITINVEGINSIQIPAINFKKVDGIEVSVQEAKLEDNSNRGEQTATLTQTVTYVIKQPGRYSLGGEKIDWWHLEDGLKQANFDPKLVSVSGVSPLQIKVSVIIVLIIALVIFFYFKVKKMPPSLYSQLKKAFKTQQWGLFIALLYQKADANGMLGLLKESQHSDTAEKLLSAHYQKQQKTPQEANISSTKLKELIK